VSIRLVEVPKDTEGACNFCTAKTLDKTVWLLASAHPYRNWTMRVCDRCLDKLVARLKEIGRA
jgi:hypothetical protein